MVFINQVLDEEEAYGLGLFTLVVSIGLLISHFVRFRTMEYIWT